MARRNCSHNSDVGRVVKVAYIFCSGIDQLQFECSSAAYATTSVERDAAGRVTGGKLQCLLAQLNSSFIA